MKNVLKQCARLCIQLGLIEGNTLFADGSKIRANASIKHAWTKQKCQESLKSIDKRIEAILSECDTIDEKEQNPPSLAKPKNQLKNKGLLKAKVNQIMKELKAKKQKSINTLDKDCTRINSLQGSRAGYNAQVVTDEKHGLIVTQGWDCFRDLFCRHVVPLHNKFALITQGFHESPG